MAGHHPLAFDGNPLTLVGTEIRVGDKLPEFSLIGNDMGEVTLKTFSGKNLVIASIPSLDTPVCSMETRRFSEEIGNVPNAALLAVSEDLPFAQKRWCGAEGVKNAVTASNFKSRTFGQAYGVGIKEWGLLSRAVFVADKSGTVKYVEYVPEIGAEPNYEAAIDALKKLG